MVKKLKTWKEIPIGGLITEAGVSINYETGDWKTYKPILKSNCTHCMICWLYCPDSAIIVKDGKVTGIDYNHCKGCGVCSRQCPLKDKAMAMELDKKN